MRKKHPLIIILSLIILAAASGYGIFRASPSARNAVLSRISRAEPDTVAAAKDTVPYIRKLQSEIPVMKILKAKRAHREVWMVGQRLHYIGNTHFEHDVHTALQVKSKTNGSFATVFQSVAAQVEWS